MRSITAILGAVLAILTAQGHCFTSIAASPDKVEIPSREFALRRASLATLIGNGVVVAFGGRRPVTDFSAFFQLPSFYYLTNFQEPDARTPITRISIPSHAAAFSSVILRGVTLVY